MKNFESLFKNKKITLMGLGLLGRGVGDAAFFAEADADLTVTDLKTEAQLESSLDQLKKFKNIHFALGGHRLEDFQKADMIVKAAGVPMNSPFILEAQKNNIPVVMSTALFAEYTEADIVGITGTRGKSTVAYLVYEILKEHCKKNQVFIGGNILGVSTIDLLSKTSSGDIAVLELDSWQLQGFANTHNSELPKGTEKFDGFSPKVAVFTTFMFDHMNYYQNDLERYFADKANIYRFQTANDCLIVSEQVMEYIKKFGPQPKSKVIVVRTSDVPDSWKPHIVGEHNKLNIALAMATAKVFGVPERTIEKVVEHFKAAPGRLEHIRTYTGIDIYNDTNATTPEATVAALEAFPDGRMEGKSGNKSDSKTILIFGGSDKKLDPAALFKILPTHTKAIIMLPGTGTDIIKPELDTLAKKIADSKNGKPPIVFVKDMEEAVEKALSFAEKGDRILMSPAFASFTYYKNEYDRGDQFNAIIKKLK